MSRLSYEPGPSPRTIRANDGSIIEIPEEWQLVPPGDAALTRRIKAAGNHFAVKEKKGRRMFSRGVWAPAETIHRIEQDLVAERSTDAYAKKQKADRLRRAKQHSEYVDEFFEAVLAYLDFHPTHELIAVKMAKLVTEHATPVGSGTVARTKRIPVERRAEAAVIAWMRHQTTAYDDMIIPREKGKRREVRRRLAAKSKSLLVFYREGKPPMAGCPLMNAVTTSSIAES